MRILTASAFAILVSALLSVPAATAQGRCDKPAAEMTPDEYVECVSVGGAKNLTPPAATTGGGRSYGSDAPKAAGRGVTAAGTTESDACSRAKARAGGNARGNCSCSQKSAGRFECTVATANTVND